MTTREIIAAALALPRDARAQIVDELMESLTEDGASEPELVEADPKLLAFIRARREAAQREPTFSVEQVFAELRAK